MKKNQNYFILNYSAFAIVYLLCKNVEAEAIYTEIDPDIILSEDGDAYNLDMNNDGLLDFKLQKISGSFYSYWSENISYAYYIAISPWQSGNKMAGLKSVISPSYGGFTQYFPFALNSMHLINEDLTFQNNNFEILAYIINSDDGASQALGGQWFYGLENKFLGVRFKDSLDCFHYGWIRCSITSEADSLTIHDYGYETKCETGIMAGDTIGDTSNVEISELDLIAPTIYSYSGTICINIDKQLLGANFSVVSFEGKVISSGCLNELNNKFNSVLGNGTYIVTVNKESYSYSKQIIQVQ